MNKLSISASLLTTVFAFAQEQDSIKSKEINEVVVQGYITRDRESVNKMPLKEIENPQFYNIVNKKRYQRASCHQFQRCFKKRNRYC